MKTNTIAQPPVQFHSPQGTAAVTCLSGLGRFLLAVLCAALVSFIAAPVALAGGADGEYQFVSASGTITLAGETQDLPQEIVQQLASLQTGGLVVTNNKISIDRKILVRLIKKLAKQFDATVEYNLSGPTSLKLTKHGRVFTGSTSRPVKVSFDITVPGFDQTISGNLKTDFDARVRGRVMTLHVPVSGKVLGENVTADLTITLQR